MWTFFTTLPQWWPAVASGIQGLLAYRQRGTPPRLVRIQAGLALTAITAVIVQATVTSREQSRSKAESNERQQTIERMVANEKPLRLPQVKGDQAIVAFGPNRVTIGRGGSTRNKIMLKPPIPVSVAVGTDGAIRVDGSIKGPTELLVADISESMLSMNAAKLGYDANSDESAVEVVDKVGKPILQVEMRGNEVRVRFVEYGTDGLVSVCNESGCFGGMPPASANAGLERVFCYPRAEFPGRRGPKCDD